MKKFEILILTLICTFSLALIYSDEISRDLGDNILRMHIIANSNSQKDQSLKLKVRDEILKVSDKNPDPAHIEEIAEAVLKEAGTDYMARAELVRTYVPEKEYINLKLPEGRYNCLRVILGEGSGENWWCIAYPPLCFTEEVLGNLSEDGQTQLECLLDKETLKTIVKNGGINIRFKIVEEIKKLKKISL